MIRKDNLGHVVLIEIRQRDGAHRLQDVESGDASVVSTYFAIGRA